MLLQLATEAMQRRSMDRSGKFGFCSLAHLISVCGLLVELSPLSSSASHSCAYNAPDCQGVAVQAAGRGHYAVLKVLVVCLSAFLGSGHEQSISASQGQL